MRWYRFAIVNSEQCEEAKNLLDAMLTMQDMTGVDTKPLDEFTDRLKREILAYENDN